MLQILKRCFTLLCLSTLIFVTIIPLTACNSKKLDSGEIIDNTYVNESIGMTMTLPSYFSCKNTANQDLKYSSRNTFLTANTFNPENYMSGEVYYVLIKDFGKKKHVKEIQKVMEDGSSGDLEKVTIGSNDFAYQLISKSEDSEFKTHTYILHRDNYMIKISGTFSNDQLYQNFLTSLETLTFE